MAAFQFASLLYIIFVGYNKSPEWAGLYWIKIGPWIHVVLTLIDFLVIPLLVIIHTFTKTTELKASLFTAPLLIYPIISFCIILQFPVYIVVRTRKMGAFVR